MPVAVSVVIPAYNMDFCIEECLRGLKKQTFPAHDFEIILIDDGSRDQTLVTAQRLKTELGLDNLNIIHQENAGPAAARNHGIRLARGDIIAFLDSDCAPEADWLEKLITPLWQSDDTSGETASSGQMSPKTIGAEGKTLPAPGRRTLIDHTIDNPDGGFFWTCNIAYRRDSLLAIGGFDEGFPLPSGEDIDIAHRMQQLGEITFAPGAIVHHLILSRSFMQHFRTARTFSSMIRLHRKHPGLLTRGESFAGMAFFQFRYLLLPIITQRREFMKAPLEYLQFALLQMLMALDTFVRLPLYYQEATGQLLIRETLRDSNALKKAEPA